MIYVPLPKRTNVDVNAERRTMVGIYEGTKCYQIYCHYTKNVVQTRDVTFIEDGDDHLIVNEFSMVTLDETIKIAQAGREVSNITVAKRRTKKPKVIKPSPSK